MKKKTISRVLALALASAMTLGLAACGGNGGDSSQSSAQDSSNAGQSAAGSSESSTGSEGGETTVARQTITWSAIDLNAGNNNVGDYAEEIMQKIEDYVGHERCAEREELSVLCEPFHHAYDHVLRRNHDR